MKTTFTEHIDLLPYLEKIDLSNVPTQADVDEAVRKALLKGRQVLMPMGVGQGIEAGDVVTLAVRSQLPRFNKSAVPVTVGSGFYDKELEQALLGHHVGDSFTTLVKGTEVQVTVLEAKRRSVPTLKDEMVEELGIPDVHTLSQYRVYYQKQMMNTALGRVLYELMTAVSSDYPVEVAQEDIEALGALEEAFYVDLFQKEKGVDLRKDVPQEWKENFGVHSLQEFIATRRDWYKTKAQQSLLLLSILGLPCEGENDPLSRYEAYSELQIKMMEKLEKELTGRKEKNG